MSNLGRARSVLTLERCTRRRFVTVWSGVRRKFATKFLRFCRAKPDRFGQRALEIWPQFLPQLADLKF